METTDCTAPSYAELRPLKPTRTGTFPVYPDLVETLLSADDYPDPDLAYVMAVCSAYAYSDAQTVSMIMARLGLEDNDCLMISQDVDVLFITSTAFLLQSKDGRVVILCYRGTSPTNVITWLTDLEIDPVRFDMPAPGGPRGYAVHAGFYRNVRSTRYAVERALTDAIEGRSVRPGGEPLANGMEALYITGHSLGGASAMLLATMLLTVPEFEPIAQRLRAVYTIGAPMIGSPEFAAACNEHAFLRERVIRYVYASDVVPQLPPAESGPFAHFGAEYQYKPAGDHGTWQASEHPRKQLRNLVELVTTPLSVLARQFRLARDIPFHASLNDHLPQYYIEALTPPGVQTEFGD